ncbi:TIGR03936 family radical SAM-associated protein [Christensenellaceae bacterium OttesenSCG-928-K19]|nr:TIGR03936 family radical SAM-associated protein [Christensenellaceae bacterium OttesenSCG-928-K19]
MRVVLKYMRKGAANYISHLDMQRAFGRAVRRAGIDVVYSQGFNPHILMSFASPLSVGYATNGDYLEMRMQDGADISTVKSDLNAVFTSDIQILDVFEVTGNKKLMSLNDSAAYSISFTVENEADCVKIKDTVQKISQSESYIANDRRGKPVDIVPLIRQLSVDGSVLYALLKNTNDGALNPAVLAEAVLSEAGVAADYEICRLECYGKIGGGVLPFTALKEKAAAGC